MSQVYTAREIEAIRSAARQKGVLEGHDIGRAEGYRAGLEAAVKCAEECCMGPCGTDAAIRALAKEA